jgi:hypothetical protein
MIFIIYLFTIGFGCAALYYFIQFILSHFFNFIIKPKYLKIAMVVLYTLVIYFTTQSNTKFSSSFKVIGNWYPTEDVKSFDAPMSTVSPEPVKELDSSKSSVRTDFNNAVKQLQEENKK